MLQQVCIPAVQAEGSVPFSPLLTPSLVHLKLLLRTFKVRTSPLARVAELCVCVSFLAYLLLLSVCLELGLWGKIPWPILSNNQSIVPCPAAFLLCAFYDPPVSSAL